MIILIKGSWLATKVIFKVIIYGGIVLLLIYIKNLYSDSLYNAHVIAVSGPDIIDITELEKYKTTQETNADQYMPLFAEQMDFYSHENQEKLKKKRELLEEMKSIMTNSGSYKDTLKQGLRENSSKLLEELKQQDGAIESLQDYSSLYSQDKKTQEPLRKLRPVDPEPAPSTKNTGPQPVGPDIINLTDMFN